MGKWEMSTIGEINKFRGNSVAPSNHPDTMFELYSVPSWDNGYPEIVSGSQVGSSKQTVEKDDVLLCKINPRINRVWVVKDHTDYPLIASSEWIVIRNQDIDSRFLRCYLESPKFRDMLVSEQSGIGGSLTRAQPKQVQKYPVPLPPLPVQRRIADLLDRASGLIEQRKAQIEKLDLLVKSQFVEMFGDPVTNPMGWEEDTLQQFILFLTSGSRGWSSYFCDEGEIFLTIKNVKNSSLLLDNLQHILPPDTKEAKRTRVQPNDLLISITADLGRTAIVNTEVAQHGAYINQHLSLVRLDATRVNPMFISYYLESQAGKRQFEAKNQVGVKSGLNFEAIESLILFIPPVPLQNEFAAFVERVKAQKAQMKRGLELLELNYKSLMQKCFRGELY